MGCTGLLPPEASVFRALDRVCEDCFGLFRDQEVYHMCR